MDLQGKVAVVTGAASGIGRALADSFAAAGSRVVLADLDGAAAEAAATAVRERGQHAVARRADAASEADLRALIDTAEQQFGPVDVFVANAGILGALGLGDDGDWDRVFEVNLRAHIRAAQLLVPGWQRRGAGHFVSVASAAGLLTQLGGAGYAVTKHAAVGFAEWLAVTYGDDGVGVTCVCPMGVNTPLLTAVVEGQDAAARLAGQSITAAGTVVEPEDVAEQTVAAVRDGGFLVLPHPQVLTMYQRKGADYDGWIAGMRRYQRTLRS
jgi:NAD(P)-dependent dehydrogenase (short-subunit alcohol dehydrogenase family)